MTAEPRQHADERLPSLGEIARVWARIGCLSFGGPAGQIALMHKELVEERRWIGEERFLHALNYCMLLPGPEAQQLATYIGWLMHRAAGGLIAGLLFVIPGALVMLGLSVLYVAWSEAPLVDAAFVGVKAAVLAVVIEAVIRIGRRALKTRLTVAIAAAAFLALFVLKAPFPAVILAAALAGWLSARRAPAPAGRPPAAPLNVGLVDRLFERGDLAHVTPDAARSLRTLALWLAVWLAPPAAIALLTDAAGVWREIGPFFASMAAVTFGGAYAVLSYVAQAAVEHYGWLRPGEMMDGLGLAETTPGPLILVTQFVGFLAAYRAPGTLDPLVAGALGALLATWVTFAPCFMFIFAGAPHIEALRANRALSAALACVTAAVVGVILNLAAWFGLHLLFRKTWTPSFGPDLPALASLDARAALLSAAAMVAMLGFRLGLIPTLAAAALAGLATAGL